MEINDYQVPFMATHPTLLIKEEIKARGMSQKELAERMNMKTSNLSRFLKGENISVATAQKLEAALDIPSQFWLNMQANYDKDVRLIAEREAIEHESVTIEKMLSSILNLGELYRRLGFGMSWFVQKKLEKLHEIIGCEPMQIAKLQFMNNRFYKKSDKLSVDERNQNTWLALAYIKSKGNIPSVAYAKGNAGKAARELSELTHKGVITESDISRILNGYGIAYCVVEKLDKTPIDAACMVVDGVPCVIVTHRVNDMSRLIFNVLHELGHIELHVNLHESGMYISGDAYSTDTEEEREANEFAEDMLIGKELWNKMMNSKSDGISAKNIVGKLKRLSEENHLDFNIVVWRYKYESNTYKLYGTKAVHIQ